MTNTTYVLFALVVFMGSYVVLMLWARGELAEMRL